MIKPTDGNRYLPLKVAVVLIVAAALFWLGGSAIYSDDLVIRSRDGAHIGTVQGRAAQLQGWSLLALGLMLASGAALASRLAPGLFLLLFILAALASPVLFAASYFVG